MHLNCFFLGSVQTLGIYHDESIWKTHVYFVTFKWFTSIKDGWYFDSVLFMKIIHGIVADKFNILASYF